MKRKILLFVGRTLISISLVGFLLFKLGVENLIALPSYLAGASYRFLLFAILAFLAAIALGALRWGKLLEVQGVEFEFVPLLKLTFLGVFFSNFLPGSVGGDAVKLFYTARKTRKTAGILASILLDRILGIAALLAIAVFSLPFSFNIPALRGISFVVLVLFIVFLSVVFLFFTLKNSSVPKKIYKIRALDLGNKIKIFKDSVALYRKAKNVLAYAFLLAVLIQIFIVLVAYFVAVFLGFRMPSGYFLLFVPLIQLLIFLPVSVNGIGIREWSFVMLFSTAAALISQTDAFALSIGFYAATLISSLPGGIIYLLAGGEMKKVDNR